MKLGYKYFGTNETKSVYSQIIYFKRIRRDVNNVN